MLAGLATSARLTGLALLPFFLLEAWPVRRQLARLGRPLLGGALLLLGFGVYLASNQLVLGNPLAFIAVQRQHWGHTLTAPWVGFADAIRSLQRRIPWERLTVGAGEMAGGVTACAATTLSWLRLRPADAVYATVVTVMVTFLPFWLSIPRYLLGLYPLFLLVGGIRQRWLYQGLVIASILALIVFGLAFGRGYWAF